MSDPVETAIETTVPVPTAINVPPTAAAVVVSLAAYGAQDLTRKAIVKVKQIRLDRKVKKALKQEQTPTPQS